MPGTFGPDRLDRLEKAVLLLLREHVVEIHAVLRNLHYPDPRQERVLENQRYVNALIQEIEEGAK